MFTYLHFTVIILPFILHSLALCHGENYLTHHVFMLFETFTAWTSNGCAAVYNAKENTFGRNTTGLKCLYLLRGGKNLRSVIIPLKGY